MQEKELAELRKKLEEERKKYEKICGEKKNLEGELESLSQALFEEVRSVSPIHSVVSFWTTLPERMCLRSETDAARERVAPSLFLLVCLRVENNGLMSD